MGSAASRITTKRSRLVVAATMASAVFASAVAVALIGAAGADATASCGVPLCGSVQFIPYGNGTGEIVSTTNTGTTTSTIACLLEGGIISGTCANTFPLNGTLYFKLISATGSKSVCNVFGCTATGVHSVTVGTATKVGQLGFALIDPVRITVTVTGTGSGEVSSTNQRGIDCGEGHTACSVQFAAGSTVTLKEAPLLPSTFSGWTGACGGTGSTCSVPATGGTSPAVGAGFAAPATPPPTPKATPRTTAAPTPAPPAPTPPPGASPGPRGTAPPVTTPQAFQTPLPAATQASTSESGAPVTAETASVGPVAVGGLVGSLPPLATPNDAAGQASSTESGGSILIPIAVAALVLVVGGVFVFRKPASRS